MTILEIISILILAMFIIVCVKASVENGTMGGYILAMFLLIPLITIILNFFIK